MAIFDGARTRVHTTSPTTPWTGAEWVALILVVIGALNWGLVGLFGLDLVAALFGSMSTLSRIVYVVVALAGLFMLSVPLRRKAS